MRPRSPRGRICPARICPGAHGPGRTGRGHLSPGAVCPEASGHPALHCRAALWGWPLTATALGQGTKSAASGDPRKAVRVWQDRTHGPAGPYPGGGFAPKRKSGGEVTSDGTSQAVTRREGHRSVRRDRPGWPDWPGRRRDRPARPGWPGGRWDRPARPDWPGRRRDRPGWPDWLGGRRDRSGWPRPVAFRPGPPTVRRGRSDAA